MGRVPEYPHPPLPEGVELPPKEAPLIGGPFDGRMHRPCIEFYEPGERCFHLLYEKGIIEDATLFSKEFPEGARYRWAKEEKSWKYIDKKITIWIESC